MRWIRRVVTQDRRGIAFGNNSVANFLTPARIEEFQIYGAVYGADSLIRLDSLRLSSAAVYRHADPAYIFPDQLKRVRQISGNHLYLGHTFRFYGHFLLETLPMLNYPMNMRRSGVKIHLFAVLGFRRPQSPFHGS